MNEYIISNHIEADTRILFHIQNLAKKRKQRHCNDSNVLATLLYHAVNFSSKKLWMELGRSYNNSRRYIDVTLLAETIGKEFCKALPSYHALSGCDYSSSFLRKGKIRPLHLALKMEVSSLFFKNWENKKTYFLPHQTV